MPTREDLSFFAGQMNDVERAIQFAEQMQMSKKAQAEEQRQFNAGLEERAKDRGLRSSELQAQKDSFRFKNMTDYIGQKMKESAGKKPLDEILKDFSPNDQKFFKRMAVEFSYMPQGQMPTVGEEDAGDSGPSVWDRLKKSRLATALSFHPYSLAERALAEPKKKAWNWLMSPPSGR